MAQNQFAVPCIGPNAPQQIGEIVVAAGKFNFQTATGSGWFYPNLPYGSYTPSGVSARINERQPDSIERQFYSS